MNIINNIIDSWKHIPYTLRHYRAFLKTEKKYLKSYKYKFHDLDKVLMYILIPWVGTKRIKEVHRFFNSHHIQNYKNPLNCNYEEAAIDWECCRFTKPNEPMSAREYLKYKKGTLDYLHYYRMDEALKRLGL